MRLLNCRTKAVEEFAQTIPPYAILSHTWENQEVLFDDLRNGAVHFVTPKKGWHKVELACEQALRDGLAYLWVDTICINKSSSTELSEAINSMFKWYGDSAICYAYLCDLPAVAFEESRWFTRGWTLQEMIAPKKVNFYDKNWTFLGTKADMVDRLHRITRVDAMILQGGTLRLISVARKMSWAANRQTTRAEDTAYCLLGLFGISMPMLYGEGDKAFIRLEEAIVQEYEDDSLFAWKSDTAAAYTGLFAPSPSAFADSGCYFPCQSRLSAKDTEPITVSNRGLRIKANVYPLKGQNDPTLMVQLNCKKIHFNTKARERIGIAVTKPYGVGAVYTRCMPNTLPRFSEKGQIETIFASREFHMKELDLMHSYGLWIRTFPAWPSERQYQFYLAHPAKFWDQTNNMFRYKRTGDEKTRFAVVFRMDDSVKNSYFIVFLELEMLGGSPNERLHNRRMWCGVKFYQSSSLEFEDLDSLGEVLHRQGQNGHNLSSRDCAHQDSGEGLTLKCYTQLEVMYGQHLFCADLHVKKVEPS